MPINSFDDPITIIERIEYSIRRKIHSESRLYRPPLFHPTTHSIGCLTNHLQYQDDQSTYNVFILLDV